MKVGTRDRKPRVFEQIACYLLGVTRSHRELPVSMDRKIFKEVRLACHIMKNNIICLQL